jgi:hypothetical protein
LTWIKAARSVRQLGTAHDFGGRRVWRSCSRACYDNPHGKREILALSEYQRWEQRFGTRDYAFGKEPNYFLKSCKPMLPKSGKALAVADGEGRNGVWLAEQGLEVLSIDFSPSAQRKAKALARERGVEVAFELADVHT